MTSLPTHMPESLAIVLASELSSEPVQVRGFWYPISPEEGILASRPFLKSCCVGKPETIHERLIVRGAPSSISTQSAVTLEGIIRKEMQNGPRGELIQLYVMDHPKIIELPTSFPSYISLLFIFFVILFVVRRVFNRAC